MSDAQKKKLAALKEKLEKLNAKHPETHDEKMRRAEAPTSYAKNRADTVKAKHEHERAELMRKINILKEKIEPEGGRRTRRRRGTRSTRSTRALTARRHH